MSQPMVNMNWKPVWDELPNKDGIYLCQIEEHYGIFRFSEGRFHSNEWGDYSGVTFDCGYIGGEYCITHWMELPNLKELNDEDIKKYKKWRKKKKMFNKRTDDGSAS